MKMQVEICTACERIVDRDRLVQLPLGNFICLDAQECIAAWNEWNLPPSDKVVEVK